MRLLVSVDAVHDSVVPNTVVDERCRESKRQSQLPNCGVTVSGQRRRRATITGRRRDVVKRASLPVARRRRYIVSVPRLCSIASLVRGEGQPPDSAFSSGGRCCQCSDSCRDLARRDSAHVVDVGRASVSPTDWVPPEVGRSGCRALGALGHSLVSRHRIVQYGYGYSRRNLVGRVLPAVSVVDLHLDRILLVARFRLHWWWCTVVWQRPWCTSSRSCGWISASASRGAPSTSCLSFRLRSFFGGLHRSLFLLTLAGSLTRARRGQWTRAMLYGIAASMTKIVGILIPFPLALELWRQRGLFALQPVAAHRRHAHTAWHLRVLRLS